MKQPTPGETWGKRIPDWMVSVFKWTKVLRAPRGFWRKAAFTGYLVGKMLTHAKYELVASSRINTGGSASAARATANSWRPWLCSAVPTRHGMIAFRETADELSALASFDTRTERIVQDGLVNLMRGRTSSPTSCPLCEMQTVSWFWNTDAWLSAEPRSS